MNHFQSFASKSINLKKTFDKSLKGLDNSKSRSPQQHFNTLNDDDKIDITSSRSGDKDDKYLVIKPTKIIKKKIEEARTPAKTRFLGHHNTPNVYSSTSVNTPLKVLIRHELFRKNEQKRIYDENLKLNDRLKNIGSYVINYG